SDIRILSSAGGLVAADRFVGKDSILSGPAGGVVGFASVAENAGFAKAIGFDMGGTSTDVARYDGGYTLEYETIKAGVRIVSPMMAIETVAAGGGSICGFDGVKLVVGPASAGADPGPACYGRGGPLAVTDINLALGKIAAEQFPFPLDHAAMTQKLEACRNEVREATGTDYTTIELADGFLKITNANMAAAISSVSIAQGVDPRDYVLVAFGGAAAQHACAVARELGIRQVLNHPDAGILSAYGIGQANVTRFASAGVYKPYSSNAFTSLEQRFVELAADCRRQIEAEGISPDQITVHRALDLRYVGYDSALTVAEPQSGDYAAAFADQHQRRYGYIHESRELEIVAARVEAVGHCRQTVEPSRRVETRRIEAEQTRTVYFDAAPHRTRLYERTNLKPGDLVAGPAVVLEPMSTTVVDPGWQAEVLTGGELLLTDATENQSAVVETEADPVMLEIFNNHFASIAEQMGITLRNTSISVNVKERLDFSCALFTPEGHLVVNAPHIPVHLGAMGETVRCIIADNPAM
ncbi:MAG: hydantoinase/oxoprolinase family protein, partial [Pirellulales bacterium]